MCNFAEKVDIIMKCNGKSENGVKLVFEKFIIFAN